MASLPQAMHVFPVARDASRIWRVRLDTVPMIVGGRTYRHRRKEHRPKKSEPLNQGPLRSFASRMDSLDRTGLSAARSAQDDTVFFIAEQEVGNSEQQLPLSKQARQVIRLPRRSTSITPPA